MTRKRYSSASLSLLLALGLTIVLSVWCVTLIVSADRLRAEARLNGDRLVALEAVRQAIADLDDMLATGDGVPDVATRDDRRKQAIADLAWLRSVDRKNALGPQLDRLEGVLARLDGVDAGAPIDRAGLAEAKDVADDSVPRAMSVIHRSTAQIMSRLDAKWEAIDILAILAVATSMVLLLRLRSERRNADASQEFRGAEERFRTILEAIPEVVLVLDESGRYRHVYSADEEMLVDHPSVLIGRSIHEVFPEDSATAFQRVIDSALESRSLQQFDYPLELAGEERWFSARVVPFETAPVRSVLWVARDVTARKRLEGALRDSEARFRQLAENFPHVIRLSSWPDGEVVYVNRAYEGVWGVPPQQLYDSPRSWQELIHPEDRPRVLGAFESSALEGTYDQEFRVVTRDGCVRWLRDRAFPIRDPHGDIYRVAGITEDVTDRKVADERLREAEELFRTAFEKTAVGMALVDPEGSFKRTNEAFRDMFGHGEDALRRMTYRDLTHPDDLELSVRESERLLAGEIDKFTMEKRYVNKSGEVLWGLTSVSVVRSPDGGIVHTVAETQDISERKRAERDLKESEERLRQLTENIREVFWMTTADGNELIYVNPAFEEIWGRTCESLYENIGQWLEAIHDDDRERVRFAYARAAEGLFDVEYRVVRPDATIRWIRDRAFPVHDDQGRVRRLAGIAEDITELVQHREHLETLVNKRTAELQESHARLRVTDRLAMVGTMSAGLVHDMNTVLFTLRCRLGTVKTGDLSPEAREVCDSANRSVDYLQRLCNSLRWLAVDPQDARASDEVTVIGSWWRTVRPLMRQMMPRHVPLETEFQESLPPIAVAPHQLTQAVLNLVINAAEATRESKPVRVWARRDTGADVVLVGVSDQGCGMTEEVRRRAFDPFFSTKGRSLSTGLGLSVVHGVVAASGGTARIDSEPGRGTTVSLRFPVAGREAMPAARRHEPAAGAAPRRGQATISVHDPGRAQWISQIIRLAGFDTDLACNGAPTEGSSLWVTEPGAGRASAARAFREQSGGTVILLGPGGPEWEGAVVVDDPSIATIRKAVRQVVPGEQED